MNLRFPSTIKARFFLFLMGSTLLVSVVTLVTNTDHVEADTFSAEKMNLVEKNLSFQSIIEPLLVKNDLNAIQNSISTLSVHSSFISAELVSPQGRIIASSSLAQRGKTFVDATVALRKQIEEKVMGRRQSLVLIEGQEILSCYPIDFDHSPARGVGGGEFGFLLMRYDMAQALASNYREEFQHAMIIVLVYFLLILFTGVFLYRNIISRLSDIANVAQAFGKGDYDVVIPPRGHDEISVVARTFNAAVKQIKETQFQLIENEKHFRQIFFTIPDPVLVVRLGDRRVMEINEACEAYLMQNRNEVIGMSLEDAVFPIRWQEQEEKDGFFRRMVEKQHVNDLQAVFESSEGNIMETLVSAQLLDFDGEASMLLLIKDISRIKATENRLRMISAVMEQAPLMIEITDSEGRIEYMNPKFTQVTGYGLREVKGKKSNILLSGVQKDGFYDTLWGTISAGAVWQGEMVNKKKDGELYFEYSTIAPIFDEEGAIIYYVAFKDDLTEKKQKEKLMMLQNRHAQMGEMLSMIAHQWRQPLATVGLIAGKVKMFYEMEKLSPGELYDSMDKISGQIQYLSQTITDFRSFFKADKKEHPETLGNSLKKALSVIGKLYESNNIPVSVSDTTRHMIPSHSNELVQVFINLLKNALDNFLEYPVDTPEVSIRLYEEGENTVAEVADNGGGIPEAIMDDIFLPYFSTKDEKQGTGLGLYMSKIIVEEHCGGTLQAYNGERGAVFVLRIPYETCQGGTNV